MSITGIEITKISRANPDDARGAIYNWSSKKPGIEVAILKRKEGSIAGNHFHKGIDPSKNPETFFMVEGKAIFTAINGVTKESFEIILEPGMEVKISPGILHSFKALTNIIFIEFRQTYYDKKTADTYPAEDYDDFVKSMHKQ
jgi:dTDP-4-dehydrorhamnose 3,5-epimerase-like enzyme